MFLKEFFKNCAERRAKKAHEKEAKYAELASKKKYWARSKELYDFLWSAMLKMDRCSPITITCGCELYSVGGLAYSVDKRLRVNVIKYFDSGSPFSLSNSFHYEAEFLIDDVVVDFDFTKPWYSVGVKSYGETVFMPDLKN